MGYQRRDECDVVVVGRTVSLVGFGSWITLPFILDDIHQYEVVGELEGRGRRVKWAYIFALRIYSEHIGIEIILRETRNAFLGCARLGSTVEGEYQPGRGVDIVIRRNMD